MNARAEEDSVQTRIRVTGVTSLAMTSEPGDPLGNGQSYAYASDNATFGATANDSSGVTISLVGVSYNDQWSLGFAAPVGAPLTPGFYEHATRSQTAATPGLSISRYFSGCEQVE